MSRLAKLKSFFTPEEAAVYLSNKLEAPVSLATIYQLIIDGKLTLSVRLINQAYVLKGQVFECEDGDLVEFKTELTTGKVLEKPYFDYVDDENSIPMGSGQMFVYDNKAHVIDGIWDLAMLGEESLQVERLYQNEVNGPQPLLTDARGFYLRQDEIFCRLITKSKKKISDIQDDIAGGLEFFSEQRDLTVDEFISFIEENESELSEDEIENVGYFISLATLPSDSLKFFEDSRSLEENDAQLVIKTSELTRIIQLVDSGLGNEPRRDKSLLQERTTFLIILYVFLREQKIDPYRRGVTSPIKLMTENAGFPLSDNTIRNVLGQICNELDSSGHEDKELSTRERQTFIKLLYALFKEQGINPSESVLLTLISEKASAYGYQIQESKSLTIVEQVLDLIA